MKLKSKRCFTKAPFKAIAYITLFILTTSLRAQEKPETYVVKNLENLGQIALRLYGRESSWKEIADENHLSPPYILHEGQKLTLKRAPTISPERGSAAILASWRRRFGLTGEPQVARPTVAPTEKPAAQATAPATATQTAAVPAIARAEILTKFIKEREELQKKNESTEARTARDNFELGKEKFNQKDYKSACPLLHESRTQDAKQIAYWLYELRCLKESHANSNEVSAVAKDFKETHPTMKELPFLKTLEQEAAPNN